MKEAFDRAFFKELSVLFSEKNYRYVKDGGFGAFHCAYVIHILG